MKYRKTICFIAILFVFMFFLGLTGCSQSVYSFSKGKNDITAIMIVQLNQCFPDSVGSINDEVRLIWLDAMEIVSELPADSSILDELHALNTYRVFPPNTQIIGLALLVMYNDNSFEVISHGGSIVYSKNNKGTYDYSYNNIGFSADAFSLLLNKY